MILKNKTTHIPVTNFKSPKPTGLWLADLTVTQILQEGVEEGQRGAINGVQSSLNQSLDLLRSVLIIILPRKETFGFLVLLSFLFVSMA